MILSPHKLSTMSLNKEIKELDEERLKEGEKSRAYYNSINLPGDRVKGDANEAARERVKAMKKERDDAEQHDPYA